MNKLFRHSSVILLFLCSSCSLFPDPESAAKEPCLPSLELTTKRVFYESEGVKLAGGTPKGGYYSGSGVQDNVFYPQETAPDNPAQREYDVEISYSYGSGSAKDTIHVFGYHAPRKASACPKCGGTRKIKCPICHGNSQAIKWTPCARCQGAGVLAEDCSGCGGDGKKWYGGSCGKCEGKGKLYSTCPECQGKQKFPCCPDGAGWVECDSCSLK